MSASLLGHLARSPRREPHRPWPRHALDEAAWRALAGALRETESWDLLALWGEPGAIHAALRDTKDGSVAVASLDCPAGSFPSLSASRPSVQRFERAIRDLVGLEPDGLDDTRPWLDHGLWPVSRPLADAPGRTPEPQRYRFLPVLGEDVHQIPVGPVHAGIIEPGHFRFHASGETVVRLEERLGYVHKGIEHLMAGKMPADAARLAGRVSGDSTVAHSLAFARAVEAALGVEPPPRAQYLRGLMAELERIANHLGDVGAICNDASFAFMQAHCTVLRERMLRAAAAAFGHRLMMDRVVPGGVAADLSRDGEAALRGLVAAVRPRFRELVAVYDDKPSLADRTVATGITDPRLVRIFAAGGYVGRAAGRDHDARRSPGYPPYDGLDFKVAVRLEGDVDARVWVRIDEIETSLTLISVMLDRLTPGEVLAPLPAAGGEGMALVEGFRGEILTWVRLGEDGRVARCHLRDPSWLQWPLLEAAIEGNIVADFPLCNKSFNCSYSGHDL